MNLEKKYIIDLLRGKKVKIADYPNLNINRIIEILEKHKLFLHYYDSIYNDIALSNDKNAVIKKHNILKKEREDYLKFLGIITNYLNENKINYFIYKGFALEKIIYNKMYIRQYGDIDIITENINDTKRIITLLKEKFKFYIEQNPDTELLGEQELCLLYNGKKFYVEFKNSNHLFKIREFENYITINHNEICFRTFSLEVTLLQLIVYYYEFTENLEFISKEKKCVLQYPIDLYEFLKKYSNILNWDYIIDLAQKYQLIHKIRICFLNIHNLVADNLIIKLLSIVKKNYINYEYCDILDVGRINWQISTIDRFLYNNEIQHFLNKFCSKNFVISEHNRNLYKMQGYSVYFNDHLFNISFNYENGKIKTFLTNAEFFKNDIVIYIVIYASRQNGEFVYPFIPVSIRNQHDEYVYSWMHPSCKLLYNYDLENEFIIFNHNYIQISKEAQMIEIDIDLKQFPHNININDTIGINIFLFKIFENKVIESWNLIPYYDLPLILHSKEKNEV